MIKTKAPKIVRDELVHFIILDKVKGIGPGGLLTAVIQRSRGITQENPHIPTVNPNTGDPNEIPVPPVVPALPPSTPTTWPLQQQTLDINAILASMNIGSGAVGGGFGSGLTGGFKLFH